MRPNRSEYQAAKGREYRAARKAKGQCLKCKQPVVDGLFVCADHRERNRQKYHERQALLTRLALCTVCGKVDAPKGYKTCPPCRTKKRNGMSVERIRTAARERQRERRAARRKKGLCLECNEPATRGTSMCATHRAQKREAAKRRRVLLRNAGLCVLCGRRAPETKSVRCDSCRKKLARHQRPKQDGTKCES